MEAIKQKELLHLRIEQANDKLLEALVAMTEGLFKVYQPEVTDQPVTDESVTEKAVIYAQHLMPRSREEVTEELNESMADYERGDYVDLDASAKEAATW